VALGDKVNKIQMESLDFLIPKNLHQHAHSNVRSDSSSQSHAHSQINDIESPTTAASHPSAIIPGKKSCTSNCSHNIFPLVFHDYIPFISFEYLAFQKDPHGAQINLLGLLEVRFPWVGKIGKQS